MPNIALRYNPDGTARATLVDVDSGELVTGFGWAVNVFPDDSGDYLVQAESLDGVTSEVVATVHGDDQTGAREQGLLALRDRAIKAGYTVEQAVLLDDDEVTP